LRKLEEKGVDMIAANRVGDGMGFEVERNELEVFWKGGRKRLPLQEKRALARSLARLVASVAGES